MSIEQQRFCTRCGQAAPSAGQFCGSCGSPLEAAARTQVGPLPSSPLGGAAVTASRTSGTNRKRWILPIVVLAAVVLLAAAGGTWLWLANQAPANLSRQNFERLGSGQVVAGFQAQFKPVTLPANSPDGGSTTECRDYNISAAATLNSGIYAASDGARYAPTGGTYGVYVQRATDTEALAKLMSAQTACIVSWGRDGKVASGSNPQDRTAWWVVTEPQASNPQPILYVTFENVLLVVTTMTATLELPPSSDLAAALRSDVMSNRG